MAKEPKNGSSIGGLVFVGCMFLGAGIGMACGARVHIGGAIGMGVGFLAMAGVWAYYRSKGE